MMPVIPHSRPWIDEKDISAVDAQTRTGHIAQGARVKEFEREVSVYLDSGGGVATASGSAAIVLALRALKIRPGSEVIVPTYVCRSVLEAVLSVGAVPVLCDVSDGWVMTKETVLPRVSKDTSAIVAVHIFGLPADIEELNSFGLPVIEDACQALGLCIRGRPAGSIGVAGVLSFHATKCMTTGEGGMLVSSDGGLLDEAMSIRDGGGTPSGRVLAPLSDLQASLGISQLGRYEQFLQRRRQVLTLYSDVISQSRTCAPPAHDMGFLFRLPLRTGREFMKVQSEFLKRGVNIRRGVDQLLHRIMGQKDHGYPNASKLYRETFSVPFYPSLTDDEIERVCGAMVEVGW